MKALLEKYARLHPMTIAAVALVSVLCLYAVGFSILERLELDTVDLRFKIRGTVPTSEKIVLAVIDEKSLAAEGKWVWPRSKFVSMIENLSAAGARVIAFDIGFLEVDTGDERVLDAIKRIETVLPQTAMESAALHDRLETLKIEADQDKQLADAIERTSARVVLGYFFHGLDTVLEPDAEERAQRIRSAATSLFKITKMDPDADLNWIKPFGDPQSNVKEIADATPYSGYFNIEPDRDGVIRELLAVVRSEDGLYAPLSLVTAGAYLDAPPSVDVRADGVAAIRVGDRKLPVDKSGNLLIDYRGGVGTFPHVSLTDIIKGDFDPAFFKEKIVIVGATAIGIYDMRVTPLDVNFPGMEVHANAVDNILTGRFLARPGWMPFHNIAAIVLSALFLALLLPRMGIWAGTALTLGVVAGYAVWVHYLFVAKGLVANMVYPVIAMALMYVGVTIYQYFIESRQKRFIKNTFEHYLAPDVIEELLESPEKLELGGEERIITAFFSDLQGFTSISESLEPKVVAELLKDFLTEMTDIILLHKGTVDKFEGDAIIAFFGAPKDIGNHALAACRAALDMQKRLAQRREDWEAKYHHRLRMRIGMATGPAVVGNMGSKSRFDYTMIGDTVNTAARLEGINKFYGSWILAGEQTQQAVGEDLVMREVDRVQVVGRTIPVTAYEIVGAPDDAGDALRQALAHYAEGLDAYRSRRWDRAIDCFKAALALKPEDGPGQEMLKRSREFLEHPPDPGWDTVFRPRIK